VSSGGDISLTSALRSTCELSLSAAAARPKEDILEKWCWMEELESTVVVGK
jgi:hypothetical protein